MSHAIKCDVCGDFADQDFGTGGELISVFKIHPKNENEKKNIWLKVTAINANATNTHQEITRDLCFNCTIKALKEYKIVLTKLFKSYNE